LASFELCDGKYPDYHTVSYTWGDPVLDHTIIVNGCELMVTTNVHEALKQLREHQHNGVVISTFWWIDLITIN
jgi:hypothetical protein